MKVYLLPQYDTALSVVIADNDFRILANSIDVIKNILKNFDKKEVQRRLISLYKEHPELFWALDETIKPEANDEVHPEFVGKTPRQLFELADGVLY